MTGSPRSLRDWRYVAKMASVGFVLGIAGFAFAPRAGPVWTALLCVVVFAAAGVWGCLRGGRIDEVVLAAHKTAWLWGGWAGSVIGVGLVVWGGLRFGGLRFDLPSYSVADAGALATGAAIVVGCQYLFHLLVWSGWWRSKSRE